VHQLTIEAVILPRSDLRHDEAIRLGEVIQAYLRDSGSSESIWTAIAESGVVDLLAGEMPKPLGLVMTSQYRALTMVLGKRLEAMTLETVPSWLRKKYSSFDPSARAIFLELAASRCSQDPGEPIRSLVNALPTNLLNSVFISLVPRSPHRTSQMNENKSP